MKQGEELDSDGDPEYELQPQMKHLCQTLDAFIFVIDASESKDACEYDIFYCRT